MKSFMRTFVAFIAVALVSSSAFAGVFNYNPVVVGDVTYSNIFETTNTNDPLFGQPSADGNDLDFDVPGFSANAVDGEVDFLNGAIELTASSNSGQSFNSVELDEFGIFFNSGSSAFSSVTTFVFVTVGNTVFSHSETQEFSGSGSGMWNIDFKIDIPDTQTATIQIHNILLAQAGAGDVASIAKRDVDVRVEGTVIPEPTMASILFAGLIGTCLRRRRS